MEIIHSSLNVFVILEMCWLVIELPSILKVLLDKVCIQDSVKHCLRFILAELGDHITSDKGNSLSSY